MDIIFKKGNGRNSITCQRPDKSSTWTEADSFMVSHDLTHFVVEKKLGLKNGFYGLLSDGIDITDFEKKQKITPKEIPAEGIKAELLVNMILTEKNDKTRISDFNQVYNDSAQKFNIANESFSNLILDQIHSEIDEMLEQWKKLKTGETIRLKW